MKKFLTTITSVSLLMVCSLFAVSIETYSMNSQKTSIIVINTDNPQG
ncbi:hypothetical protein [Brevibacillus daliensis]|nr:hypothetical protein [Brevibacillus daliensis]